ncbi:hypothetical protein GCM10027521_49040 [Amycolatopsis cihanbeyliensis]
MVPDALGKGLGAPGGDLHLIGRVTASGRGRPGGQCLRLLTGPLGYGNGELARVGGKLGYVGGKLGYVGGKHACVGGKHAGGPGVR